MKLRLFIACIILWSNSLKLIAQDGFADSLLRLELEWFETTDERYKTQIAWQKLNLYLERKQSGRQVLNQVQRIEAKFLPDSLQSGFYWNAALLAYLNEENYLAHAYMERYVKHTADSTANRLLLHYLILQTFRQDEAASFIEQAKSKDSSLNCLSCLQDLHDFKESKVWPYKLLSAFLPGAGMMLAGKPGKGLVALGLNAGSVLLTVWTLSQGLYVNAAVWGLGLFQKFYSGNLRLTEKTVEKRDSRKKRKLAAECELSLKILLDRYPLTFK